MTQYDFQSGELYLRIVDKAARTLAVVPHESYKTLYSVVVRSTIVHENEPYTITTLDESAFAGCEQLLAIYLPDTVTALGRYAFEGCIRLEEVLLSHSLESLEYRTFAGCTALRHIILPDSIEHIHLEVFADCSSLEEFTIHEKMREIRGNRVFRGCTGLRSVRWNAIHAAATECNAERGTFEGLPNLTDITFGPNVQYIPSYLCAGLTSIRHITLPEQVAKIGEFAFAGCEQLTSISLPDTITEIGKGAFAECTNLVDIHLPSGLTTIEYRTFYACSALRSITLPPHMKRLKLEAFALCGNLCNVGVEATTPPELGGSIFSGIGTSTVHVPCEAIEAYESIRWGGFIRFVALEG